MPYNKLKFNKYINEYDVSLLLGNLEIDDAEIELIKNSWIPDFNWLNINTKNKWNGCNIAMTLVVLMQDNVLKDNILTETIPINILISTYTYFLAKVILNKDFDINAKSYTDSTLLSNVIRSNNIDILKFLLNNRKDLNVNLCKSRFWNTYLDIATESWHFEIFDMLQNHINEAKV